MRDKPLPSNIEAECATIGSIFIDRDSIIAVAPWLKPEHFYLERHAWIYEAQLDCFNRRVPPDLISVSEELRRRERLEKIGGRGYLIDIINSVPTAVHIEYYAHIVEATGVRRQLIDASAKIARLAYDETQDVEQLAGDSSLLLSNALRRIGTGGPKGIGASANALLERIDKGVQVGLSTGLVDLDDPRRMGGLHRGRVYLLAGMPGTGKSALAWQIAKHAAQHRLLVLGYSLEMSVDEITQRYVASETAINLLSISQNAMKENEIPVVIEALDHVSRLDSYLYIDDDPSITVSDVRLRSLQFMAEHGSPDCIVVDYALLLVRKEKRKSENAAEEIDLVVRSMKALAREVNAPVIVIQQMNREGYKGDGPPRLNHLYMGGEKDADVVMFLTREELTNPDTDKKGIAELHIAKHRGGPAGITIPLQFMGGITRFADLVKYQTVGGY